MEMFSVAREAILENKAGFVWVVSEVLGLPMCFSLLI